MKNIRALFLLAIALTFATPAMAQGFAPAGQWQTMKWSSGTWSGMHELPDVYCLLFPRPASAVELGYGFYNDGSIFFTQVLYTDNTAAFVVVSTIPPGRSPAEEVGRLLANERRLEAAYGIPFNIVESRSDFGPTIHLKLKDVAPRGRNAPFPLVRPIFRPARSPIESLAVHRLFVRGLDRFEVATFQLAPNPATDATESEMTTRLTELADQVVKSIYDCTKTMPARSPR